MTDLPIAPAPWHTRCTAHLLPYYTTATHIPPHKTYAPLEASSPAFSSLQTPNHTGGLSFAQIIRYTETPVGAYDELALLPGYWRPPADVYGSNSSSNDGRRKASSRQDLRITGIWVSSQASVLNGRQNWGIPKHMARFKFTPMLETGSGKRAVASKTDEASRRGAPLKVEVFPYDVPATTATATTPTPSTLTEYDTMETSVKPFFTAVIHEVPYVPALPFASNWCEYVGLSTRILQPPLPVGKEEYEVGTENWMLGRPILRTRRAKAVWFDMRQAGGIKKEGEVLPEAGEAREKEQVEENWWPGMRRWNLGLTCENATLDLGEPEVLGSKVKVNGPEQPQRQPMRTSS